MQASDRVVRSTSRSAKQPDSEAMSSVSGSTVRRYGRTGQPCAISFLRSRRNRGAGADPDGRDGDLNYATAVDVPVELVVIAATHPAGGIAEAARSVEADHVVVRGIDHPALPPPANGRAASLPRVELPDNCRAH